MIWEAVVAREVDDVSSSSFRGSEIWAWNIDLAWDQICGSACAFAGIIVGRFWAVNAVSQLQKSSMEL